MLFYPHPILMSYLSYYCTVQSTRTTQLIVEKPEQTTFRFFLAHRLKWLMFVG
jgi:hypothetical protein